MKIDDNWITVNTKIICNTMSNKTSWHIKPEKLALKVQNITNGKILVQKYI